MTRREAFLDYADRLLDGEFGLGAHGPRTAALLARSVLEEWLDEQSASWLSSALGFPSTRSKSLPLRPFGASRLVSD
jgi:hypothetical protein